MKNNGFSLLETIAAMIILGIGLVTVLGAFSLGNTDSIYRQEEITGLNLLQLKMEEVKSTDFISLFSQVDIPWVPNPAYRFDIYVMTGPGNLKKVDVTLKYASFDNGHSFQKTVSTYVADR